MSSTFGRRTLWFCTFLLTFGCASSRFQNAERHIKHRNWSRAQAALEEEVQRNPRDGAAHLLLAEVYGHLNQIDKLVATLATLEALSAADKRDADYLREKFWIRNFQQGYELFRMQEYDAAIRHYRNAIALDASKIDANQHLGDALFMSAQYRAAAEQYARVLEQRPDNLILKNNLAEIYFIQHNYADAVRLCDEILAVKPDDRNAVMRRAYAREGLGQSQVAEDDFRRALEANPSSQLATDLGLLLFRQGRLREAVDLFEQALETTTTPVILYRYLGEAHWKLRNYAEMARWYTKVVDAVPDDLSAWKNLAVAYETLGQPTKLAAARQSISKITSTN